MSLSKDNIEKSTLQKKNITIPNHWKLLPFDKCVENISLSNCKIQKGDYLQNGEIPIIDQGEGLIGGLTNDRQKIVNCKLPIIVFGDHTRKFKFINFPFVAGADGIKVFQTKLDLFPKFLYYFFQFLELPNAGYSRHFKYLKKEMFPCPPIIEQKQIVEKIDTLFSQLDAGMAALKRAQANLERYRASMLKAACEGRLVPTEAELAREEGRDYEPASVLLERILDERRKHWEAEEWDKLVERAKKKAAQAKLQAEGKRGYIRDLKDEDWQDIPKEKFGNYLPKSDKWKKKYKPPKAPDIEGLPELPEGWVWATFEQVADIASNLVDPTKLPNAFHVAPNNIESATGKLLDYRTVDEDGVTSSKHKFFFGQILYSKIRPYLAKVVIVDFPGVCSADMYPINSRILTRYLFRWMLSLDFTEQASNRQGRTVLPKINKEGLYKILVPVPPMLEQERIIFKIDEALQMADKIELNISLAINRSERLSSSILTFAFEGKLT